MNNRFCNRLTFFVCLSVFLSTVALAENNHKQEFPWMNQNLSPDERAELVLKQMTLDEKIELLHGNGMAHSEQWQMPLTYLANGGAGYVVGVKRLGIPPIWMSDAAYGVRMSAANGRYSTALPSNLGSAASWAFMRGEGTLLAASRAMAAHSSTWAKTQFCRARWSETASSASRHSM